MKLETYSRSEEINCRLQFYFRFSSATWMHELREDTAWGQPI